MHEILEEHAWQSIECESALQSFATLTPWLLSLPLHSAYNVTPANGPAPVGRSTYFGYPADLTGVDIIPEPFPTDKPEQAARPVAPPRRSAHALTQCPNDLHRYTLNPDFSNTTCKFVFFKKGATKPKGCTAWFASCDGDGYMMVTAGHCVAIEPPGSRQYFIDPNASNQVCCKYNDAGTCVEGMFAVRAWVATQGWYTGKGTNDGVVIWVEQVPQIDNGPVVPHITPVL
jgi:hypothetical protein